MLLVSSGKGCPLVRNHFSSALIALLCGVSVFTQGRQTSAPKNVFEPGELVQASDIPYPFDSVAVGTVLFELTIDVSGNVEDVFATHSIPSLVEPSMRSIRTWKFRAATLDGKPVRSRATVAVMFNPFVNAGQSPPSPSPARESRGNTLPPNPAADVLSAVYVIQPMAALPGSVVLKARIAGSGEIEYVNVVRDFPPFTSAAMQSLSKWSFKPAKFQGEPLASTIAVAFVFRLPSAGTP